MEQPHPHPHDASPLRWTESGLLSLLRRQGARTLTGVTFRENRRTIWSVTRNGRQLNLHAAYRRAPDEVVAAFAVLVGEVTAGRRGSAFRKAASKVRGWPGVTEGIRRARRRSAGQGRRSARRNGGRRGSGSITPGPCCATDGQRDYLQALYGVLARRHCHGVLPPTLHLRLSRRMTSRLGHMRGGYRGQERHVVEIALSLDLMLPGNEAELVETLLHEMAHAADWLRSGGRGHGSGWKVWARRVGCSPGARCTGPLRRRRARGEAVETVPDRAPEELARVREHLS